MTVTVIDDATEEVRGVYEDSAAYYHDRADELERAIEDYGRGIIDRRELLDTAAGRREHL